MVLVLSCLTILHMFASQQHAAQQHENQIPWLVDSCGSAVHSSSN